jgi:hypothetical protein
MTTSTLPFEVLQAAVRECTSYDLIQVDDEDADMYAYALIDPFGDRDGDLFYELADVEDYITNNSEVEDYLDNYIKEN